MNLQIDKIATIKQYLIPALEENGDVEEFIRCVKRLYDIENDRSE